MSDETLAITVSNERASWACDFESASKLSTSSYKKSQCDYKKSQRTHEQSQEMINRTVCHKPTPKYGRNKRGFPTEFKYCSDCFKAGRHRQKQAAAVFDATSCEAASPSTPTWKKGKKRKFVPRRYLF